MRNPRAEQTENAVCSALGCFLPTFVRRSDAKKASAGCPPLREEIATGRLREAPPTHQEVEADRKRIAEGRKRHYQIGHNKGVAFFTESDPAMTDTSPRPFEVTTFGETMLRLHAPGYERLEAAHRLEVRIGGSESNTAVALARLGLKAAWWSKLPDNSLGRRIENELHRWGIDTSAVLWDKSPEARAGLYFLDFGTPPRGTEVLYDRAHSSASHLYPSDLDSYLIERSQLLHLTGITPALSASCADTFRRAIGLAKQAGTKISLDTNYRSKLWSPDTARHTLSMVMSDLDLLITPQSDAEMLFGITGTGTEIAREFRKRFGVPAVVVTCGSEGAFALDDRGEWFAEPHELGPIVDRVGAGDAFDGGVLYGYLQGDLGLGLDYGVAMAALKHTIPGDLLIVSRDEIERVRAGGSAGIRR